MSDGFVLRRANILDASGRFAGPLDVRVRGGLIEAVGPDLAAGGLRSFDLADAFLMPGVFDCHAHPSMTVRDPLAALRMPITAWAVAAADALRRTLRCGVTFVRDAGGTDPGLRQAIAAGHAEGPQLQLSIVLLSQTGGQMDGFLAGPGIELATNYYLPEYPGRPEWLADGVDEVRRAVRQVLRAGGDWIKLCAGSGPHVEGQTFGHDEYSAAEVAVAVEEAARRGRFVMADSKTPTSIEMCVRAGVRSIEHGLFLDEERARLMAERGTWLVPTHAVYRDAVAQADAGLLPEAIGAVFRSMLHESRDLVRIARAAGVRIALGSDAFGEHMLGTNLHELAHLKDAGMPCEEVLLTATSHGAQLCGVADRVGRIEAGYVFDAIVLDDDPSDLEVFRRPDAVTGVFQAGRACVLHPRLDEMEAEWPASS